MTHTEPANPKERSDEDAIRALCDAATPGPWLVERGVTVDEEPFWLIDAVLRDRYGANAISSADEATIRFIAAARTRVPALLAALAAARSDADQLRTENERLRELLGIDKWGPELEPANIREVAATEVRRLVAAERDAARVEVDTLRAKIEAVEFALVLDGDEAISPTDPRLWHLAQYMDGWDAAVDACRSLARAALAGAVPGSPPEPAAKCGGYLGLGDTCGRPEGHAGQCWDPVPAVVPGSPETRQEEQR